MIFEKGTLVYDMRRGLTEAWFDPSAPLEVMVHGLGAFGDGLVRAYERRPLPDWTRPLLEHWWATNTELYLYGMFIGRMSGRYQCGEEGYQRVMRLYLAILRTVSTGLGPNQADYTGYIDQTEAWLPTPDATTAPLDHWKLHERTNLLWEEAKKNDGHLEPWEEASAWAMQAIWSLAGCLTSGLNFKESLLIMPLVHTLLRCPSPHLQHMALKESEEGEKDRAAMRAFFRQLLPVCPLLEPDVWELATHPWDLPPPS